MTRRAPARGGTALAEQWLLTATRDQAAARAEWRKDGITLLKCGEQFTAVRLSYRTVRTAAGIDEREEVSRYLRRSLRGGAVFVHPRGQTYYALVSLATSRRWADRDAEVISAGTYLGVPALERVEPVEQEAYWTVPLSRPGAVCGPVLLDRLLVAGRETGAHVGGYSRG